MTDSEQQLTSIGASPEIFMQGAASVLEADANHHNVTMGTTDTFCVQYIDLWTQTRNDSDTNYNAKNFIYAFLFFLSVSGLIFVATTIYYNKKLQAHPQPLIAVICVVEALMSYNALLQVIDPSFFACYFGLD